MRKFLLLFAALFSMWHALADSNGTGTLTEHTLKYKGEEYTYHLYLPKELPADAPLVLFFHGYGTTNVHKMNLGFNSLADEQGFAVCYPSGPTDHRGHSCWAVGYSFHTDAGWERDDVGFTKRLVKHLQREYGLSRHNVFVTGHSNGGEMSYLLAYEAPEVFAAVAPIAGLTMEWMYRELTPKCPMPLLEIHGTADKVSKWEGDPDNQDGWGEYIAVPRAVSLWAATNRCTHEVTEELPTKRNRVVVHRYVDGIDGNEVWLYEVIGGQHAWPDADMDTAAEIWEFFSKYIK
ncbi:MAG: prolyl oligopeptidase family serine peptidase [Rikenellaceae bacterium]|nr:prolyl oligopeptidase family serine peptidase [Rikenellaceae bacterium]